MIVEFIGLPGSGKTTILKKLAETLPITVPERVAVHGLGTKIKMCLKHPYYASLIFMLQLLNGSFRKKDFYGSVSYVKDYDVLLQKIRLDSSKNLAAIDEGVVHGLFSLLFNKKITVLHKAILKRIFSALPINKIVYLYLGKSKTDCISNFSLRGGYSRFNKNSSAKTIEAFYADRTYPLLLKMLQNAKADVRIVNTENEVVYNLKTIAGKS